MIKFRLTRLRRALRMTTPEPQPDMTLAPLFDRDWYLMRNPEVARAGMDPMLHYTVYGFSERRDPHPLFDTNWYLTHSPDVQAARIDPLRHFLEFGGLEGRDPHPLFSSAWYLSRNPDVVAKRINPLVHYLNQGAAEGREPHPLFDTPWYLAQNGHSVPRHANPLRHYVEIGSTAALSPHPLLDARAYLDDNPDVAEGGHEPLAHFLTRGRREGRNPHRLFQTDWYLDQNPSVAQRDENPLLHYITAGAFQGCNPNPVFDNDWYIGQNEDVRESGVPPLAHYVAVGAAEGRRPSPDFDPAWYAEANAENGRPLEEPLAHYLYEGRQRRLRTQPFVAHNPVAVVYLVRSVDGSTAGLDRFARSYAKFAAGLPHDLIVIRKGAAQKPGARQAIALMFEGVDVQYVDVDDSGFDIHAYLAAAAILPHAIVCFLNSYAEIAADDWLKKLHAPMMEPGVGLAGATASYESITDTMDVNAKVVWLADRDALTAEAETLWLFHGQLQAHAPVWVAAAQARLQNGETKAAPPGLSIDREVEYSRFWLSVTKPGGPLHPYEGYRRFPNPHIRSNGFIIRRSLLLSFGFSLADTKEACNRFESGPGGLPDQLAERGLRSVLVGADGATFEVGEWASSNTFRLGNQHNVLIRDNRVDEFEAAAAGDRDRAVSLSWGAYGGTVPDALTRLGFGFGRQDAAAAPTIQRTSPPGGPVTIAVTIPTHNRLSLVRDALTTLIGQSYPHWTCTVFDNASTEPLRAMVESFSESRISYARSDSFLPVTDSWNRAIDLARGDYVLLIGDDDGLAPNALETVSQVVHAYDNPDLIYSALYQFFHPGVAPWEPSGYVSRLRYGFFFSDRTEPFRLDPKIARLAVAGSLGFRRNFTFNMQAFFFRQGFLDSLRRSGGKVFQSPFPDYYLANVAMALAKDVVVLPDPVSIAGVSRKSFGFTLFNNLPEKGDSLLATDLDKDRLYAKFSQYMLHGASYDTKFALTMEHVADALGPAAPAAVNVGRYRRLQIFKSLGGVAGLLGGSPDARSGFGEHVRPRLSPGELEWAEGLQQLGGRAATGDAEAIAALEHVAAVVAMYAPPELAVQADDRCKGDFDSLPRLFAALKSGHLTW